MSIDLLKTKIGDAARDIRLNISSVLTPEGAPELTQNQIFGIALASAYATKSPEVIAAIRSEAAAILSEAEVTAAKSAAAVMAMNNIYYRFVHLASDKEFARMPAKLRMNVIGSPGIEKVDFELYSLAVSAINGCGMCMDAHVHEVVKAGMSKLGVQSAIRIAAVVNAAAQAVVITEAEA
ncbi:carboxymuconolactone decarboxylase family protein [Govanella unica]|uniref:Alkyl hydroperoxide reductase AhpD n=1 Tax=Govanella unica TaxID=2975056 RepID=A0A9X3Z6M6_9PROT|nr:carboxymuconolactone decarboxylase family protein [Govania unica]MDA5193291.1 carboxymuconolactone decarboxylase family protein [Govania unica]